MFDVGFTELLLIGVVALVVIGPERLPDVARTAGKWIAKTQRFVRGVKTDIANELDSGELKKLIGDQREQIDELRKVVGSTRRDLESSTKDAVRGARKKLTELEDAASRADAADGTAADATPPVGNAIGGDGTIDGSTSGRTTPPRATPVDGANAAAKAIGGAVGAGTGETSDGSDDRAAESATRSAPRPSSGQVDGQVIGETHGAANEAPPASVVDEVGGPPDAGGGRAEADRSGTGGSPDGEPADVRQSGSGG